MTSREQFEKFVVAVAGGVSLQTFMVHDSIYYKDSRIQGMWRAWQASRAAIEIELPSHACLATWHYAGSGPDDYYEDIDISKKPSEDRSVDGTEPFPLLTKWEVEQAIEQAGLKVKK